MVRLSPLVSIIIPTLNGGEQFRHLLYMIKQQQVNASIEIIVVDSSSSDSTVDNSLKAGAKVIPIRPEDFNHAYARNTGADHSRGQVLLFTTQDVLMPDIYWLQTMLDALGQEGIAAVSCAETPREDADLYYRCICWNHYRFLGVSNCDRIFSLPDTVDNISLRKNGQLSDLACMITTELFRQYRYRTSYAEDLDLGIRLIQDGKKILFLGRTRVIHSHNRPPYYSLKRSFVETRFMREIFPDYKLERLGLMNISMDILSVYCRINDFSDYLLQNNKQVLTVGNLKSCYCDVFLSGSMKQYPFDSLRKNSLIDDRLWNFLQNTSNLFELNMINDPSQTSKLLPTLNSFMNMVFDYLFQTYDLVDLNAQQEFISCIFKAFAQLSGMFLAQCYLTAAADEKSEMENRYEDVVLGGGV